MEVKRRRSARMLTYADSKRSAGESCEQGERRRGEGTHFTCFTGIKVQILTKGEECQRTWEASELARAQQQATRRADYLLGQNHSQSARAQYHATCVHSQSATAQQHATSGLPSGSERKSATACNMCCMQRNTRISRVALTRNRQFAN